MNIQPITAQDLSLSKYRIAEIFYSIQGEGPWQGYPCIFIRLAGCNLRCTWCDTDYSTKHEYTSEELLNIVETYPGTADTLCRVVITGGEPFAQNLVPLVELLLDRGYYVQVETNGTLSNPRFPFQDDNLIIVCSPKAGKLHKDIIFYSRHFKYVIGEGDTEFPEQPTQAQGKRPPPKLAYTGNKEIWVMPRDDGNHVQNTRNRAATVDVALKNNFRLCLQAQKILRVR